MDLLSDLNESQKRAVTHIDGPLLVLAGAGSGKTRVITRRVAHLVSRGVSPRSILAITFTNKAAGEMARRVESLGVPRGAFIGTFHSFCFRLLREFADRASLPKEFTIYDKNDQTRCIKDAMKRLEIPSNQFAPGAIQSAISNAKNGLIGPERYSSEAAGFFQKTAARVYTLYQRILAENGAVDFDDLLLRTACLMRDCPDLRELLGRRHRYILIDEYQDTNHTQYVIAHGIAMEHENICVTGDPDQSIYAWRGADISNILEFESDYPNAMVVRLEENYRSTQPILTVADRLIANNRRRKHKRLISTRGAGIDVGVIRTDDEHAEAAEVTDIVASLGREGIPCRNIAVFYRVNALSRLLEEAFRRAGIAYQIARGVEFFNRKEIKDVLAYLRLLVNRSDDLSCRRIINVPARGIGATTVDRLAAAAEEKNASLLATCADPTGAGLAKAAAARVASFSRLINELSAELNKPVRDIVEKVVTRSGLEAALKGAASKADDQQRQELRNVEELITSAAEFDQDNPGATLADYLNMVSLVSDVDSIDSESGAVTFMTLHAAKGLEFPAVIIIGCEEGLLPFNRGDGKDRDIEEERRLAFVGMTRAQDRLYLTSAKYRCLRGQTTRQVESPFLTEIGSESVCRIDKTTQEMPVPAYRQAGRPFPGKRTHARDGFYEDIDNRRIIEAIEAADSIPDDFAEICTGRLVRHEKFGAGKVLKVSYDGARTRAVVQFSHAGKKTLILEYAGLKPM